MNGKNEDTVRGIFRDNVLDYFESNEGLSVEYNGTHMIVYRSEQRKKADEIAGFFEECSEVHDLFRSL
ncbi:MAG: hypothetical protein VB933_00300 [Pseudomonadales bacterium]